MLSDQHLLETLLETERRRTHEERHIDDSALLRTHPFEQYRVVVHY